MKCTPRPQGNDLAVRCVAFVPGPTIFIPDHIFHILILVLDEIVHGFLSHLNRLYALLLNTRDVFANVVRLG